MPRLQSVSAVIGGILLSMTLASASASRTTEKLTKDVKSGDGVSDQRVMTSITGQELNDILVDAGFSAGKVDDDGDVLVKVEDKAFYFLIGRNRDSIEAKTAWRTTDASRPSIDRMNDWNRTKKYSKTYFDNERDPVLQLDLDLAGGVTVARIKDFALTARVSLKAFTSEVLK